MRGLSPARLAKSLHRRFARWAGTGSFRIDRSRFVAEVAPIQLPASSTLQRTPPRLPEHRQPNYLEAYDARSIFYDVFWNGSEVVFVGPPLANLTDDVIPALRFDGKPATAAPRRHCFDRVEVTMFPAARRPSRIDLDIDGAHLAARISDDGAALFAGSRALVTLSKDNDLAWIEDWVDFHARAHGVDAVLFYDNASTRYAAPELLRRIAAVPGIRTAVVVSWPFAFGPDSDPTRTIWDSDYCQYAMIEHARRRYLRDAAMMFQIDIDELVVSPGGGPIDQALQQSPAGALLFPGRWMRYVKTGDTVPPVRHRFHSHYVDDGNAAATKWVAIPARVPDDVQMALHQFIGDWEPTHVDHPMHRHFRAISTGWKYNRSDIEPFDPQRHVADEEWIAEMRRIGWAD